MKIYVLRGNSFLSRTLVLGSAVVGEPMRGGEVLVYYEGNVYGSSNIKTFADKVHIAAGRLTEKYPTVARAVIAESELEEVGTYDYATRSMSIEEPVKLAEWFGREVTLDDLMVTL